MSSGTGWRTGVCRESHRFKREKDAALGLLLGLNPESFLHLLSLSSEACPGDFLSHGVDGCWVMVSDGRWGLGDPLFLLLSYRRGPVLAGGLDCPLRLHSFSSFQGCFLLDQHSETPLQGSRWGLPECWSVCPSVCLLWSCGTEAREAMYMHAAAGWVRPEQNPDPSRTVPCLWRT